MGKNIKLIVRALVENNKNEILMLKRNSNDSFPNEWQFPGGKVEFGENPGTAIARELEEETGINLTASYPVNVESKLSEDGEEQIIEIHYKCIPLGSEEVWLSKEHTDYRWVNQNRLSSNY